MPATVNSPYANPALDAYIAARGIVVKSPASYARQLIKAYVKEHWQLDIEPDDVRLNTLIYHQVPSDPPYPATLHTSLSLTEALLNKWQQHVTLFSGLGAVQAYRPGGVPLRLVQEHGLPVQPRVYEALYLRREPQTYDTETHLNIDPAHFRKFVWETDLREQYQRYLKQFVNEHAKDYPVLGKAALIKAAFLQRDENSLREVDQQLVLRSLGLPLTLQWRALTVEMLESALGVDPHVFVAPFKVHRYCATDALVIKDSSSGRVVLYIPGNASPLHGFVNDAELARWVAEQCRDPAKRRALEGHFPEQEDGDGLFISGLRSALEGVARYPQALNSATGTWSPRHIVHAGMKIHGDPFIQVRDWMVQRLQSDARFSIHTQDDARWEGFAEGLNRSLIFTGVVALAVPEAIPFMIGLSVSLMGVGTRQAVKGRTYQARQQGGQRVVFGVLNALPFVVEPLIAATSDAQVAADQLDVVSTKLKPLAGSPDDAELEADSVVRPRFDYAPANLRSLDERLRAALRTFEAPADSVQGQPTIHGPNGLLDIYHRDGRYFLALHDKAYQVRWEQTARQWRIISSDGTGKPGPFVKQLETGQWDIDPGGLKGGMDGDQAGSAGAPIPPGPSLNEQVKALYPGFTADQTADFLAELRANGTSVEIQLARLTTEYRSLDRALDRWVRGPMTWRAVTDTYTVPILPMARRQAADMIRRCWQRLTPTDGPVALRINGYVLDLHGMEIGDLPHLPGDFSHVTAVNLSRTFISEQSASELLAKTPNLRWLNMENNFLRGLPTNIGGLRALTRLSLANNRIVLSPFMMAQLRPLRTLRLLNLERNPLGPLLDVSSMPRLVNLFLRSTGIEQAPVGAFELPEMVALDLRNNRIATLPDSFFTTPGAGNHTLLDGNPLSVATRARIAQIGGPSFSVEQLDDVDFWLQHTPALERVARRAVWDLYWAQENSEDFFGVLIRLRNSADFNLSPASVSDRVWQLMQAGVDDPALRSRLMAMAANPETCVDGATVMFSNMELEVLVTQARSLAVAGHEGPHLMKLVRGLFRLEEVDGVARLDTAGRTDFIEDVEVLLAYRVGLASRLELPVSTRTMQFSTSAAVSPAMLDRAEQIVLASETQDALVEFALTREFWVKYLETRYQDEFLACRKPTEWRMDALDDRLEKGTMTDGAYKQAADEILRQRKADETTLMKQLTQAELAGGPGANTV